MKKVILPLMIVLFSTLGWAQPGDDCDRFESDAKTACLVDTSIRLLDDIDYFWGSVLACPVLSENQRSALSANELTWLNQATLTCLDEQRTTPDANQYTQCLVQKYNMEREYLMALSTDCAMRAINTLESN